MLVKKICWFAALLSPWQGQAAAFSVSKNEVLTRSRETSEAISKNDRTKISRRTILSTIFPAALASASLLAKPQVSLAKDELFKPNPLTNKLLEQVRILEQAEADNIKYGGELAPGSPKGREAYAKLLVPILEIQRDLKEVNELAHVDNGDGLDAANRILSKPQFEKIKFKKIFNAFGECPLRV